jgi:hypothetical protein
MGEQEYREHLNGYAVFACAYITAGRAAQHGVPADRFARDRSFLKMFYAARSQQLNTNPLGRLSPLPPFLPYCTIVQVHPLLSADDITAICAIVQLSAVAYDLAGVAT